MTVKDLIRELLNYPMNAKVCNTYETPLAYSIYKHDKGIVCFESFEDLDMQSYLDAFFHQCQEENYDELDAFMELSDNGVTSKLCEGTTHYEYVRTFMREHGLE